MASLLVIGVGLIGGSVLRAARAANLFDHYFGYDNNSSVLTEAKTLGVIDNQANDLAVHAEQADHIVLALPTLANAELLAALDNVGVWSTQHADRGVVVSDTASVKAPILQAAKQLATGTALPANFVAAHPIAGSEHSGVAASTAELFQGRKTILTPHADNDAQSLARVAELWRAIGAEVVEMDAQQHDFVLSLTSHLPHILAYTLVDTLLQQSNPEQLFSLSAGGFRDFSRIASSDPTMWHDILLSNQQAVLQAMKLFETQFHKLRDAVAAEDGDQLIAILGAAKEGRDGHLLLQPEDRDQSTIHSINTKATRNE